MKTTVLNLPEIALIAGTRAAAGIGLGLLLAAHVNNSTRRTVGWALVLLGIATTFPLVTTVIDNRTDA